MEDSTFKPGDVVQLKSGSALMTVIRVDAQSDLVCTWFAENKFCCEVLAAVALKKQTT